MIIEYYNNGKLENSAETNSIDGIKLLEKSHLSAIKKFPKTEKSHILYGITIYNKNNDIVKQMLFANTCLSDSQLDNYISKYPDAIFHVIHNGSKKACEKISERVKNREIRNIPLRIANDFVKNYHRHHNGTVGCKFAIGLYENDQLIGVAICGRPVSRYLDNGSICEINRLCTRGGENACSMLYGACSRIAKAMGYKKIITYILQSESGITLKASNFVCEGVAGGTHWTGKRNKGQDIPSEMKTRWSKSL